MLLSRKKNLKEFRIRRLFLREDVPPESKFRQKGLKHVSHVQEHHTNGQEVHDDVATESSVHVSGDDLLIYIHLLPILIPTTLSLSLLVFVNLQLILPPLLLLLIPVYRLRPIFVDGSSPVLYF